MLCIWVCVNRAGPGRTGLFETIGEPCIWVAVTGWLTNATMEVDDRGDATVAGFGSGYAWVPGCMCWSGRWFSQVTQVSIPRRASMVGPGTVAVLFDVQRQTLRLGADLCEISVKLSSHKL